MIVRLSSSVFDSVESIMTNHRVRLSSLSLSVYISLSRQPVHLFHFVLFSYISFVLFSSFQFLGRQKFDSTNIFCGLTVWISFSHLMNHFTELEQVSWSCLATLKDWIVTFVNDVYWSRLLALFSSWCLSWSVLKNLTAFSFRLLILVWKIFSYASMALSWSCGDVINWAIRCLKVDSSTISRLQGKFFISRTFWLGYVDFSMNTRQILSTE